MADQERDQQFVEFVLKNIVDNPDDVSVERTIDEMGVLISVTVNPNDMGKVIGKSGQTAKAVRTLLKVVGAKNDARVNMKIIEPEGGTGGAPAPTPADDTAPGTTDGADPVPVDDTSVAEAAVDQTQSDAVAPQPSENDQINDEGTGDPQPQEPVTAEDAAIPASDEPVDQAPGEEPPDTRPAEQPPRRDFDEKSPLDEL